MTKTVGTLKEIGARFGDEVEHVLSGHRYQLRYRKPDVLALWGPSGWGVDVVNSAQDYRIVSRAAQPDTPTLWRDMTPEEKGALLLAHHEGKAIEAWQKDSKDWYLAEPSWLDWYAYRVKTEPKVETVTMYTGVFNSGYEASPVLDHSTDTHRITFSLIDGKPDSSSIRMEELK